MTGRIENLSFWILFVVAGGLFLIPVAVAIWNRDSEYSYQVLKPIFGGIGVSLLFLVSMLLSAPDSYTSTTDILVVARTSGEIVPLENLTMPKYGLDVFSGYLQLVTQADKYWKSPQGQEDRSNVPANEFLQYQELSEYILDLAEWSTLTWMVSAYHAHWQMEHEWFDGLSARTGRASVKPTADPEDIKRFDICQLLPENRFAKFYRNQEPRQDGLLLPRESSVEFKQLSDANHVLAIKTKYSVIEIRFRSRSGGAIGITDLAEEIKKELGPAWNQRVTVSFSIRPKRHLQWSKKTQIEEQWIRGLSKFYDDSFAWSHLKKKLESSLNIQTY